MNKTLLTVASAVAVTLSACNSNKMEQNPFLVDYTTQYEIPPFDQIKYEHYLPAVEKGIAEQNAEMYAELLPFAKQCGVKIAAENMWNWDHVKNQPTFAACASSEDFKKHIDIVNDPYLVACLDIGHAEMRGSGDGAVNMIRALGYRLQALHIHDTDRWHDNHQIPFSMNIDFEAIIQ